MHHSFLHENQDGPKFPFWALKVSQFLDSGSTSALIVYIGLYFKHLGFSNSIVGLLFATHSTGCFIGSIFWSYLADIRVNIIFMFIVLWIFSVVSTLSLLMPSVYNQLHFLLFCVCVNGSMIAAVQCLLDGITIQVVVGTSENYGKNRLWASLGWGFTSLLTSAFIDTYGFRTMFIGYCIVSGLNLVIIVSYFPHYVSPSETLPIRCSQLMTLDICFLLFHLFIFAHFMAFIEIFLYIYFVDELRFPTLVVGICVLIQTLTEVGVFWFGKEILDWFGYGNVLVIAMLIYVIRVPVYFFMKPSWVALAYISEPLQGVSFALAWVASVELGSKLAPKNLQTTMQGLVLGFYQRAGFGSGMIVFGILYDSFDAKQLFVWSSCALYVWCCIFILGSGNLKFGLNRIHT